MTEEIIADGVNVAGCEYFWDLECKLYKKEYYEPEDTTYDYCKEHPLCEYKAKLELQRLKQENEKLKATIYKLESKTDAMCECNKEMNEDLKLFRSALEEIREIVETITPYETKDKKGLDKILIKINEVLK